MEENIIFDNRYKLEKLLGRGAFSEVWLANDEKTNIRVALKIFAPATGLDNSGLEMFAREFSLVADVNAPNILKPLYFETEGKPYLVLQYCKNGNIKSLIRNVDEKEVWRIILEVAKGLKELHEHKPNPIVHQDIKPDNIMISDDGRYMITDFGVSVHLHSTLRKTVSSSLSSAGTRAYMAPERFGKKRLIPIMASDIWSLGAMVFELLSGDVPFSEEGGLFQKSGVEIPELPGVYSKQLQEILEKCLALDSWKRPTAEQLIEVAESAIRDEVYLHVDTETLNTDNQEQTLDGGRTILESSDSSQESFSFFEKETIVEKRNPSKGLNYLQLLLVSGVLGIIVGVILGLFLNVDI